VLFPSACSRSGLFALIHLAELGVTLCNTHGTIWVIPDPCNGPERGAPSASRASANEIKHGSFNHGALTSEHCCYHECFESIVLARSVSRL